MKKGVLVIINLKLFIFHSISIDYVSASEK